MATADSYVKVGINPVAGNPPDARQLYLDMVKRAVTNLLYQDIAIWRYDHTKSLHILNRFDLEARAMGEDQPIEAHTMIGWKRLTSVQECAESVFKNNVPGDFVETGVLRGGSVIFMRAILRAFGCTDRKVYACDSFVYDPAPGKAKQLLIRLFTRMMVPLFSVPYRPLRVALFRMFENGQRSFPKTEDPSDEMLEFLFYIIKHIDLAFVLGTVDRTSLDAVKGHFERYGLLDSQVVFLKGFFSDTLPKSGIGKIAILRLDGDFFDSTYGVLKELYDKVSPGGFVVIDDYNSFSDCKVAVDQYRREKRITEPMHPIDNLSMYWQKT